MALKTEIGGTATDHEGITTMTSTVTTEGIRDEHVVVPYGTDTDARLSFDNGTERLTLRADPGLTDLATGRFAEPYPVVWASGHDVHVEYPLGSRLLRRMRPSEIRLNPAASWSVDVHGGAAHLDADLRGVVLRTMTLHSGAAFGDLRLGTPDGTCTIRLSSVKDVRIARPAGVPVRLEIARGSTHVSLDARRTGAVGNGLADQTTGYDESPDRYLVLVSGGVDGLTIEHLTGSGNHQ